eukprot:c20340_g1_i1 orf=149-625(-)
MEPACFGGAGVVGLTRQCRDLSSLDCVCVQGAQGVGSVMQMDALVRYKKKTGILGGSFHLLFYGTSAARAPVVAPGIRTVLYGLLSIFAPTVPIVYIVHIAPYLKSMPRLCSISLLYSAPEITVVKTRTQSPSKTREKQRVQSQMNRLVFQQRYEIQL